MRQSDGAIDRLGEQARARIAEQSAETAQAGDVMEIRCERTPECEECWWVTRGACWQHDAQYDTREQDNG